MIKINYSYTILFASTVAGVGTNADSTPSAVLWRNGSASGVSVTVSTTAQTGLYKAVFTTDSGWAAADFLELYVTATIAGTAGYIAKVWSSTEIGAAVLDSAVQTQLDDIEDSIDTYIAGISAVASTTTGTIVGFPSSLNAGDSYTDEANASIHVFIRDASDDPITAVGDFNFTDPEFAPEVNITQSGSTGRVKAVVTFVEASPEDYLKVEIPSSQSRRASPGTATIQCLLKWVDTDGKVLCQKTLSKQAVTWNEMV